MKTYLVSYGYDGARWSLELKADSWEEAEARLGMLQYASVDGELKAKIPVPRLFDWFVHWLHREPKR